MSVRTTSYQQRRGAYYSAPMLDPVDHPGCVLGYDWTFETAANNDPIGSPVERVAGGPTVSSAGGARPPYKVASGGIPGHYLLGGGKYWTADTPDDFNDMHGNAVDAGTLGPTSILAGITVKSDLTGEALLFQSNAESSAAIGACCVIDPNGGHPAVLANITNALGAGGANFFPPNTGTFQNPDSIIYNKPTILLLDGHRGRTNNAGGFRGHIHGLRGWTGAGFEMTGTPSTADSTYPFRLGAYNDGSGGSASLCLHFFYKIRGAVTDAEMLSMYRWLCERHVMEPIGQCLATDLGYSDCPGALWLPNGTLVEQMQLKVSQLNYVVPGTRLVETESLDGGWTRSAPRTVATAATGQLGPYQPAAIGGKYYQAGGADASDPAHVKIGSDGRNYPTVVMLDGEYASGPTICEGPATETTDNKVGIPVYGQGTSQQEAKFLISDDDFDTYTVNLIAADAQECVVHSVEGPATTTMLAIYHDDSDEHMHAASSTTGGVSWTDHGDLGFGNSGRPSWVQGASGKVVCAYRGFQSGSNLRLEIRTLSAAHVAASQFTSGNWSAIYVPDCQNANVTYIHLSEASPGVYCLEYAIELDQKDTWSNKQTAVYRQFIWEERLP